MADFFILANSLSQQLLETGETGFLGDGGNLAVDDDAIIAEGSNDITVLGSVFSRGGIGISHEGFFFELLVGMRGQIIAPSETAVELQYTASIAVENMGYISGHDYGLLAVATDGSGAAGQP